MADGRRTFSTAFKGLVAVVFVGCFVAALTGFTVRAIYARREQAPAAADCRALDSETCERKGREAEVRSAWATEASTDLAAWQLALNLAGVLGLGLTVLYAQRAWRSSEKTLTASRESEQRQLRAYITADQFEITPQIDSGAVVGFSIKLKWKNCGQTPARNAAGSCSVQVHKTLPEGFDFPDLAQGEDDDPTNPLKGRIVRGPGQMLSQRRHIEDAAEIGRIIDDGHLIYVWGWVEYDDIFKDTPRRRTEFAAEGQFVPADGPKTEPTVETGLVRVFNGMDDDCLRKPAAR